MPTPRVFVSSTFYDLRYIRENLRFFISTLGYEPVLSEEGAVFYDPALDVKDAAIADIGSCQMFVLIIGGRRGAAMTEGETSVTNAEYRHAVQQKIPVFALVERSVLEQFRVYVSNAQNTDIDAGGIRYPSVDSTGVFRFIEEVQSQAVNNALVPFSDFGDMQIYLKQQWAGIMYRSLTSESESQRVGDLLGSLTEATAKIEFFTREIAGGLGSPMVKVTVGLYDEMLNYQVVQDLLSWGLHPTPQGIVQHETLDSFCDGKIKNIPRTENATLFHGGPPYRASEARLAQTRKEYQEMRATFLSKLAANGIEMDAFSEST